MVKVFISLLLLLTFLSASAQKVQRAESRMADTAYMAWRMAMKAEAIEKRRLLLEEWENTNIDSVSKVNFRNLYFEEVPDISCFKNLKVIEGGSNQIKTLPKSAFASDSLVRVSFPDNEIKRVKFRSGTTITNVNLSNNKLKRIPRSIRKLSQLKELDLSGNKIKRIPGFLRKCDSLQEITLNYNQVKLTKGTVRNLAHVPIILLAGNNLSELPEYIDGLTAARKLNFSKNELSDLPKSFAKLDSLTSVIFYENLFTEIPMVIFELKELIELDFYYNQVDKIPDEIGDLTNLEQVFLSYNTISKLPESMARLKELKYLYIHHNELIIVPDWFTQLSKLERMDLSFNKIMYLPDISQIDSLTEVDVQENQLETFPWDLLDKESMDVLVIINNPLILDEEEREFLEKWASEQDPERVWLVY